MNYKLKTVLFTTVLALSQSVVLGEASAAIYKCENTDGVVYYNDKPCPVSEKETEMKAVKDPEGGYIPPEFINEEEKKSSSGVVVGNESTRKIDQSQSGGSENSQLSSQGSNSSASSLSSSQSNSKTSDSKNNPDSSNNSNALNSNNGIRKTGSGAKHELKGDVIRLEPSNFKKSD